MRADNAIATMVHVGSKGSAINLCQIAGTVAQQTVEGRRIFSECASDRTLPCYKKGDRSLDSNGFVSSNYQQGLTPQEFFFHSMGGREGLVDTAVKTACTGYIQRRQVKMTEDHHVAYDGTVRTAQDLILEYVYGGDGFDASRMERYALNSLLMKDKEVERHFIPTWANASNVKNVLQQERTRFDASNGRARRSRISPMALTMDPMCVLPFNPDRVLASFCETESTAQRGPFDVSYIECVMECQEKICALALKDAPRHCLVSSLRFCFRSSLLYSLELDKRSVEKLFGVLTQYFEEAIVAAGEMVGTIAATSMGEVTTQLTLNTFHTSGVGSRAVTAGIPRLKEILDVTRKMRTPSNCLVLKKPQDFFYTPNNKTLKMLKVFITFMISTSMASQTCQDVKNSYSSADINCCDNGSKDLTFHTVSVPSICSVAYVQCTFNSNNITASKEVLEATLRGACLMNGGSSTVCNSMSNNDLRLTFQSGPALSLKGMFSGGSWFTPGETGMGTTDGAFSVIELGEPEAITNFWKTNYLTPFSPDNVTTMVGLDGYLPFMNTLSSWHIDYVGLCTTQKDVLQAAYNTARETSENVLNWLDNGNIRFIDDDSEVIFVKKLTVVA